MSPLRGSSGAIRLRGAGRDLDAERRWRRRWRELAVGVSRRRRQPGRVVRGGAVVGGGTGPHDDDHELLAAVAAVLVAADEVERAGLGEGEHRVAVVEPVNRRARVAGVVRLLVDDEHRVAARLVRERCMHAGRRT